jgi:transcriptional regulator with XRE-family HTH domain
MEYTAAEDPRPRPTGDGLRLMRLAGHLKQSDVAAAMGVSPRWVSHIEGQIWPTRCQIDRYLAALEQLYRGPAE